MSVEQRLTDEPEFSRWIPLAEQVVHRSLGLHWNDILEIYSYVPTIPLAEALALQARRAGSDTHITLMTDDLWFTSMQELPARWLRAPSQAELAINKAITASVYLGGPRDARRMRDIPPEKFDANAMGNVRQDEPRMRRRVKHVDLPIGRVCPERAEAYGLDYERWQRSYNAALDVDLREIQKAGTMWYHRLARGEKVRITSDVGTSLTFEPNAARLMVDDGIISASDVRHGFVETSLPAGKIVSAVRSGSAEGEVHFADAVFMMGQTVRGLRFKFEKGRLLEWSAEEHGDLLASLLKHKETSGNRMGWFSIGLNQEAEPCMLDNSIVHDDVGIGLGPHSVLERPKAKMSVQFEATIGPASVEIFD